MKRWLRLQALLAGLALVVVVLRTWQMSRMTAGAGAPLPWAPILAGQAAYWIAWSLWAGGLVLLMRPLVDSPARPAGRGVALVALAVLPAFLVPLIYGPAHWLLLGHGQPFGFSYIHAINHNLVTNLLLSAAIAGVAYGYLALQRARRLEVTAAELNTRLARAQLDTLRAQLNPHFLFNALNSVAVLARRGNTAEVERMVTGLAELLRHSLEASRDQLVPLRVELEAIRRYLEIEQVRHGERLRAVIEVPDPLLERPVPSFLLQPLVENAIRHGFVDGTGPLAVVVRGGAEAGRLVLSVEDDGAGLGPGPAAEGIGLGNTRARLEGLYGEKASLVLGAGAGGRGLRVTVTLPDSAR